MKIKVKNELGAGKEIKLGYSWTMFFWGVIFGGFMVPVFRGDWKWFLILFVGPFVMSLLTVGFVVPLIPLLYLIFGFFYNKIYAKELFERGFRGLTKEENDLLISYISG